MTNHTWPRSLRTSGWSPDVMTRPSKATSNSSFKDLSVGGLERHRRDTRRAKRGWDDRIGRTVVLSSRQGDAPFDCGASAGTSLGNGNSYGLAKPPPSAKVRFLALAARS
jgi:hypothetical protein